MTILYSVISRGPTVLCSHASGSGNYHEVVKSMLPNIPTASDAKTTYTSNNYMFHVMVDSGIIYMCASDPEFGRRVPYAFLNEIKDQFYSGSLASRSQFAEENELDRDFSPVLANQMERFSRTDGASGDNLTVLQSQVEEVKGVMTQNIEKVLERGERLDDLMDKTTDLEASSVDAIYTSSAGAYASPLNPSSRLGLPKAKRLNSLKPYYFSLHRMIVQVNDPSFYPPLIRDLIQIPPFESGLPYLGCHSATSVGGPILVFNQFGSDSKNPFQTFISYGESVNHSTIAYSSRKLCSALLPSDVDLSVTTFHQIDNCQQDAVGTTSRLSMYSEFDSGVGGSRPCSASPEKTEELVRVTPIPDDALNDKMEDAHSSLDTSLGISMELDSSLVSADEMLDESSGINLSPDRSDLVHGSQQLWQPWNSAAVRKRFLSQPETSVQKSRRLNPECV